MLIIPSRRTIALVAFAGLALLAISARADNLKSPLKSLDLEDGDSVVFLGDSITHQCLYTQYVEDYYYTRFPKLRIKFHNAGVGGARARDALDRFDRDVAAYKPKCVTVLLGMNDGSYRPYDDNTFQTYRKDMTELVAKIREIGAIPVLMTPTMYDARAARMPDAKAPAESIELYNSTLAYYGAWLREKAVESGDGFVDMYSLLNNLTLAARKTDPDFTMIKDAVHPDPPGQLVMAFALLNDLDSPATISEIKIALSSKEPTAETAGGKLSGLKSSAAGLEFTWAAEALPFVVPSEAEPGAKMLYLGHSLGREVLAATGLPAAAYELKIDDESVAIFTATHLARGVELEENDKTPEHFQAAEIARLNKQRNDGPVKQLRNEWSQMQQYYRLKRQAEADPNNAEAAKNLKVQANKMEGLEERIAKHEQAAKDIEDRIFEGNRPAPHKYAISPVEVATARLRVMLNGKPLAHADLIFEGDGGRRAQGITDAEGKCSLGISEHDPVVVLGQYRVAVRGNGVPAKYSDLNTSKLVFAVEAGQNDFVLDLQ